MIVLTIRTDKPDAEVGLYDSIKKLDYTIWAAHYQLAETIHIKIDEITKNNALTLKDLGGVVCFKGPGSFTGLRIGLSVGNALSYGLNIPIVGTRGKDWIVKGIDQLYKHKNEKIVLPHYGGDIHIRLPKK